MSLIYWPVIGAAVLVVSGCSETISPPAATTSLASPVSSAETIAPGKRPSEVQGAKFYTVPEFLAASDAEQLAKGDWVCVEGTVIRSGDLFGASFVDLLSDPIDMEVHCEGEALARFRFEQGTNVIIRGQFVLQRVLGNSYLVTPDAISQALADEHDSD